jgi:hypothetical protein
MNSRTAVLTDPSPNRISRSKQDSFMLRTKRTAYAFRFGDLGGNFTDWTPAVESIARNSSVNSGSRSWMR